MQRISIASTGRCILVVYVDDMRAPFGRMIMCHMMADSKEELLAMVDKIGVERKWIQHEGTIYEHFDISLGKKKLAIQNGAVELTRREFVMKMKEKHK